MMRLEKDVLYLSGDLNLDTLMDYRHEIEQQLPEFSSLTIDLSDLVVHGSAVLSLLVFVRRRVLAAGGEVHFTACSEVLRQMVRVAELEDLLGLPV